MQFVSIEFLIFFPAVVLIWYLIPGKRHVLKKVWLLLASAYFYAFIHPWFLAVLAAVTVIAYFGGIFIENLKGQSFAAMTLSAGVILLLLILCVFKYGGMIDSRLLIVPVGLSFYTLEAIGYLTDVYRGEIPAEWDFLTFAGFLFFFPKIVSGPIGRAGKILPQLKADPDFDFERLTDGFMLMVWGYFLKMILADRFAVPVNTVYATPAAFEGSTVFFATICYSMQIYCDFAGYSAIALGAARILGISLTENFRQPYLSESVPQFWRNWHISLSSWLRDYVYIPLGGSRKGTARKYLNLMLVFLVSGLWHGTGLTFLVWGLLHGIYQIASYVTRPVRDCVLSVLSINRQTASHHLLNRVLTFLFVNFAWIFFRAESLEKALYILRRCFTLSLWSWFDGSLLLLGLNRVNLEVLSAGTVILFGVDYLTKKGFRIRDKFREQNGIFRFVFLLFAVSFIVIFGVWGPGYDAANFIYRQF